MGVDVSISVGFGFIIDPEVLDAYRLGLPDGEETYGGDVMEKLLQNQEQGLLGYGEGGSMYDSGENNRFWVCVSRLTDSYDVRDIPGGITMLEDASPTGQELAALFDAALRLGQPTTIPQRFLSVLWH